jgi:hypothetical protein
MAISGSCLCGAVTYQITSKVSDVVHCHCVTCRKAHGAAFSSVAFAAAEGFQLQGAEGLGSYESSPGKNRFFCKKCGTQVYAKREGADYVILRLGSLDTYLPGKEIAHTWMSERADWFDLDADLARHEEGIEGA